MKCDLFQDKMIIRWGASYPHTTVGFFKNKYLTLCCMTVLNTPIQASLSAASQQASQPTSKPATQMYYSPFPSYSGAEH